MEGTGRDGTVALDGRASLTPDATSSTDPAETEAPGRDGHEDRAAGRCLVVPSLGLPPVDPGPTTQALRGRRYDVLPLLPSASWSGLDTASVRLSRVVDECRQALRHWDPTCVVAFGLGARVALRALASWPTTMSAVLVAPVLDLATALSRGGYGGWRASGDPSDRWVAAFYEDAERHGMATLYGSARDVLEAGGRLRFVVSLDDRWGGTEPAHSIARSMTATGRPVTVTAIPAHDTGRQAVTAILSAVSASHG